MTIKHGVSALFGVLVGGWFLTMIIINSFYSVSIPVGYIIAWVSIGMVTPFLLQTILWRKPYQWFIGTELSYVIPCVGLVGASFLVMIISLFV